MLNRLLAPKPGLVFYGIDRESQWSEVLLRFEGSELVW